MRATGMKLKAIVAKVGIPIATVSRMAGGCWGGSAVDRLVPCPAGCGTMLLRKTAKAPGVCKHCYDVHRTRERVLGRKYEAIRDLFGFTDEQFPEFMRLCRRALMKEEDLIIQLILSDLRRS